MQPLVSVICLSYNHERFLAEALDSVLNQTYPNLEIMVVDDASTDGSAALIESYCARFPQLRFIKIRQNLGNTKAFNQAWQQSKGDFIIDFSTDDVMLPNRVEEQVKCFAGAGPDCGVVYTNVQQINDKSEVIGYHYRRRRDGTLRNPPPSGDVFAELLRRYFIDPTSMMVRREVLEEMGGYDESLAYEDFDFWVRSSRRWHYQYLDKVLSKRRLHPHSLSRQVYRPGDAQLASTIKVCHKAAALISSPEEKEALIRRVEGEVRQAFFTHNFEETRQLLHLLRDLGAEGAGYRVIGRLNRHKIRLSFLRKAYYRLRYNR
jgi:glycosyltransferase involved in cell wall biosynthesis